MAFTLDFTFATLITAINTKLQESGLENGIINISLQFQKNDARGEGSENMHCHYNLDVVDTLEDLHASKDTGTPVYYAEEVSGS